MGLTEQDLATRAGTTVERLAELIAIGIIRPGAGGSEPFSEGDALRVQLVEHPAESEIRPTSVAAAIERGALSLSFLDKLPGPAPRVERTHVDLAWRARPGPPAPLLGRNFSVENPRLGLLSHVSQDAAK